MNQISKELGQPELVTNNEQKADDKQVIPSIANAHVSGCRVRPILFSGEMVRAILEGRKTQTRRTVKMPPRTFDHHLISNRFFGESGREYKPYAKICDILWVRETWQLTDSSIAIYPGYVYRATDPDWATMEGWKWKPSIFMPREAARIFLKVTNIRVERLKDISEKDANNEGVEFHKPVPGDGLTVYKNYTSTKTPFYGDNAKLSFQTLWQKINGQESLESNPFVWVIEFERCERPLDSH